MFNRKIFEFIKVNMNNIFFFQTKNVMYVSNENKDDSSPKQPQKPLEEVTCFKCGCKGHYANKCPKGHLAFLSQSQNPPPPGGYRRYE